MDQRDLSKKLTEEQCRKFHKFLVSELDAFIKRGFDYAAEHDYDVKETAKYLSSFLYVSGSPIVSENLINSCMNDILCSIIDFPNSKSSENK